MFRIKELREAKGLNMKDAARLLDMPYTTYVNYEKALREPTSEVLILLADFYDTTIDYLVGRTCSPKNTLPLCVKEKDASFKVKPQEKQMILKYRELDDRGKSAVMNALNHEFEALSGEKAHPAAKEA